MAEGFKSEAELLALKESLGFAPVRSRPSLQEVKKDLGFLDPVEQKLQDLFGSAASTPDKALQQRDANKAVPFPGVDATPEDIEASKQKKSVDLLRETPITQRHLATIPGALAIAQDDIENITMFENLARGAAEMFTNRILGGFTRAVGTGAEDFNTLLSEIIDLGHIQFDFSDPEKPLVQWLPSDDPSIAEEINPSLLEAARWFEGLKLGYKPGTTWEDFKEDPLINFLPFALEQGIISLPEMAAALLALPLYV